jgi:hypothetical protein
MEYFDKVVLIESVPGLYMPSGSYHFAVAYASADNLPQEYDPEVYLTGFEEHDASILRGLWVGLVPLSQENIDHCGKLAVLPYGLFQDVLAR